MTWYDGGKKLPEDKRGYTAHAPGREGARQRPAPRRREGVVLLRERLRRRVRPAARGRVPGRREARAEPARAPRATSREWVEAIQAGDPSKALSNFDYAGRLTETVLLGVVALKAGGKIEWDADGMKVKNNSDADQYIRRDYRKGFSIHA